MVSNRAQLLITAVDETRGAFDSIKRNLGDLGNVARSLGGLLSGLGVAVSAAGLASMVKSSLESADSLSKLSQRVGITVESLSTLIPAADLSGVSAEKFEGGLRKLATRMLEATTGSDEAARSFAAVGVAVRNQDGTLRSTDQVLLDLADRFKAMPDGAEKTALAVELFGKSGADLIPFLNQGREGVGALTAELQELGVQIGGDTAAQAEVFNDSLAKVRLAISSIGNRILEAFLPAMNAMANGMVDSAKQGGTLRAVLDGIVLALKVLALGAATVGKAFVALGEAIGAGMAAAVEALSGHVSNAKAIITELKGRLVQRLDELAEFRVSLFEPKPIEVKAPKIQADPALLQRLTKPSAGKASQDTTGAQTTLLKARLDAEFSLLKDGLARQQTALDAALDERLVSVRDYYAQKTAFEQQAIEAEIARTQQALARSQSVATSGKSENDRLRAKAEVAKLEAELTVLNNKRADVEVANARKPASTMTTIFIADSFSEAADTALASHTPETGGAWASYGSPYSGTASVIAAEGRVAGSSSSSSALYTNAAPPPSADYLVEAVVRFTSSTGKRVGIATRYAASGTENGYLVFFDGNYWVLRKVVAGVSTDLGSYYGSSSLNTDYVLRFEVFATTLTVSIDGVTRLIASDASITAAGRVGVLLRSGGRIDSLSVQTLDAQPARLAQMAVEAAISPEPPARLTQSLVEVLSQALVPSRLAQVVVETLVLPFAPARLDQVATEVLWRDPRLAAEVAPRLSGVARLDLGLALSGGITARWQGTAILETGSEFSPAAGTVTARLIAPLKTDTRLRGDVAVPLTGGAELRLGEELRVSGRLVLIARGRLAGDTPTSSAFWLLF